MASLLLLKIDVVQPSSTFSGIAGSAVVTIDLRETLIPFSLLQITNAFRTMQPGEEMEILAGAGSVDAAIFRDVTRILPRSQYEILPSEEFSDGDPVTRMRLIKKRPETTHQRKGEPSCQQPI